MRHEVGMVKSGMGLRQPTSSDIRNNSQALTNARNDWTHTLVSAFLTIYAQLLLLPLLRWFSHSLGLVIILGVVQPGTVIETQTQKLVDTDTAVRLDGQTRAWR